MAKKDDAEKGTLFCSFCGKSQHEVRKLIAGPTVFICDECVELCMDIIREEHKTQLSKSHDGVPAPSDIKNVLDEYVIGQARAKRVLAVAVHTTTSVWQMLAALVMSRFRNQISCLSVQPAVARRCWRRPWRGCLMCHLPWPMPPH